MDDKNAKDLLDVVPRTMVVIRTQMRALAKSEFTLPQFRVIARLSHGRSTNADLADWIGVAPPSMSRMVDGLVKRNLIQRTLGDKDRREVWLTLTKEGRRKFDHISQAVRKTISEKLENLTPARKAILGQGLGVLRELFLEGMA